MCRPKGVPVIVNDRLDVALAAGADGLHVGQDDLPMAAARALLGPGRVLGVSVKTVEQAIAAEAAGADYLGAGASAYPCGHTKCMIIAALHIRSLVLLWFEVLQVMAAHVGSAKKCLHPFCTQSINLNFETRIRIWCMYMQLLP